MFKQLISVIAFTSLLFIACSTKKQEEMRIATNAWIGYAPLFYAKETGKLDQLGIKLITNVSLAEASKVFEVGKADLVTTTQHEYLSLKESVQDVVPIILIDRSNGGDMIMSNKSLDQIKTAKTIYAFLEIDSINKELLQSFIQQYHLENKNFIYTNKDQLQISDLKNEDKTMLVVTYSPYNIQLQSKGFKEVASTSDINSLIVIDAICARSSVYASDQKRLKQLKTVIDEAVEEIQHNPKKVYKVIKKYLDNISYDEYIDSLKLIKWINKNPDKTLLKKIKSLGYGETIIIQ